jgi:polyisoprenoid-binding protein YceI
VERYPVLTFTSTCVEPVGNDRFKVEGDLTIRGITCAVVLASR